MSGRKAAFAVALLLSGCEKPLDPLVWHCTDRATHETFVFDDFNAQIVAASWDRRQRTMRVVDRENTVRVFDWPGGTTSCTGKREKARG